MPTACGSWRRAWQRVGKAEVNMEVEAEVVEEEGGARGGGGGEGGGGEEGEGEEQL